MGRDAVMNKGSSAVPIQSLKLSVMIQFKRWGTRGQIHFLPNEMFSDLFIDHSYLNILSLVIKDKICISIQK